MDDTAAKQIVDKIIGQVFGYQNPLSLEQVQQKFAFDISLPQQVYDSTTNEPTWAQSTAPAKFISIANAHKRAEVDDWMLPKRPINTLQDILNAWNETNYMSTERAIESDNLYGSDNIYNCENIYRSQDCSKSKNLVLCDSVHNSEFVAASQRSQNLAFCLRVEDTNGASNSFSIVWSGRVSNSFFLQDCYDVTDSMFCSHISSKQYCIANMQFTKEEYEHYRKQVIQWILTN